MTTRPIGKIETSEIDVYKPFFRSKSKQELNEMFPKLTPKAGLNDQEKPK